MHIIHKWVETRTCEERTDPAGHTVKRVTGICRTCAECGTHQEVYRRVAKG